MVSARHAGSKSTCNGIVFIFNVKRDIIKEIQLSSGEKVTLKFEKLEFNEKASLSEDNSFTCECSANMKERYDLNGNKICKHYFEDGNSTITGSKYECPALQVPIYRSTHGVTFWYENRFSEDDSIFKGVGCHPGHIYDAASSQWWKIGCSDCTYTDEFLYGGCCHTDNGLLMGKNVLLTPSYGGAHCNYPGHAQEIPCPADNGKCQDCTCEHGTVQNNIYFHPDFNGLVGRLKGNDIDIWKCSPVDPERCSSCDQGFVLNSRKKCINPTDLDFFRKNCCGGTHDDCLLMKGHIESSSICTD